MDIKIIDEDVSIRDASIKIACSLQNQLAMSPKGFVVSSSIFTSDAVFNRVTDYLQDHGMAMYAIPRVPMNPDKSTYLPQVLPDLIEVRTMYLPYDPSEPAKRLARRGFRVISKQAYDLFKVYCQLEAKRLEAVDSTSEEFTNIFKAIQHYVYTVLEIEFAPLKVTDVYDE